MNDKRDAEREWEGKREKSWRRRPYFSRPEKKQHKSPTIMASFGHAIDGIIYAVLYERNMRFDVIVGIVVLAASLFFGLSRLEFAVLAIAISFVLMSELLNTAVEAICDRLVGDAYDEAVKIAKDVSAGATFVAALNAVITGYLLFFEKFRFWTNAVYEHLRIHAAHATVVAVGLVLFVVVLAKALWYRGHGTPLHGGSVSGHTALAFCLATIAAFLVDSTGVAVLAYTLALLVAESRYEARIHTLGEIVLGSLVGMAIAAVIFGIFTRVG